VVFEISEMNAFALDAYIFFTTVPDDARCFIWGPSKTGYSVEFVQYCQDVL
jgi:hypothetical protein